MTMRKLMVVLPVAVGLAAAPMAGHTAHLPVSGEVTKVDESAGKITIKHGPIKKFDMDGMAMVFRVIDPAMLRKVKPGDKINFDVDKIDGKFTVTEIEKGK
jgi:Cu(I)/Ag(I) efflux system periplasmic protein CusF